MSGTAAAQSWKQTAVALGVVLVVWAAAGVPWASPKDAYPGLVAGELWLSGELDAIYVSGAFRSADGVWGEVMERLGAEDATTSFVYAPGLLPLVYGPLRAMGLEAAGLAKALYLLNSIALAVVVRQTARWMKREELEILLAVLMSLSFVTYQSAAIAQDSLMLAAVYLAGFSARGVVPAALVGVVSAHLKPWAPVLVLGYLAQRRWQEAASFAAGSVGGVVVLGLAAGPELLVEYVSLLGELAGTTQVRLSNLSLAAACERLVSPGWIESRWTFETIPLSGVSRGVGGVGAVAVGALVLSTRGRAAPFAALAAGPLLLSVAWHHYLALALPLVCGLVFSRQGVARALAVAVWFWLAVGLRFVWPLLNPQGEAGMVAVAVVPWILTLLTLVAAALRAEDPHSDSTTSGAT